MSNSESSIELSLWAKIEALLFIAVESLTPTQIANALEVSPADVAAALDELESSLENRGLCLQRHNNRVQLTTVPETSTVIERFLGLEATTRLSRAALETLSIIAYQQPVTRPQVDAVRGVSSDGVMRSLLSKGLIEEGGRTDGPGRPILYITTPEFLGHFGLKSLADLPPLSKVDDGIGIETQNQ